MDRMSLQINYLCKATKQPRRCADARVVWGAFVRANPASGPPRLVGAVEA